jgi:hypothetical protein
MLTFDAINDVVHQHVLHDQWPGALLVNPDDLREFAESRGTYTVYDGPKVIGFDFEGNIIMETRDQTAERLSYKMEGVLLYYVETSWGLVRLRANPGVKRGDMIAVDISPK